MAKPLRHKTKSRSASKLSVQALAALKRTLFASLPYVISFSIAGALFGVAAAWTLNSPAFRLSEVRILNAAPMTLQRAFEFCELRPGENVVTLDLVNVQQVIRSKHPEFKEVRVRRVLPNRIEVTLKRRTPVAQIQFGSRYVQVDKDLMILPGASTGAFRNLPLISGVAVPREGMGIGVTIRDGNAAKAVKLAEAILSSGMLGRRTLSRVDVKDPKNLSFYVDGDIEVRIGGSHYIERLKILKQTLQSLDLDPAKIQYVDLRFDDVVIGPR